MVKDAKSVVQQACRLVLRPIASIFIKCGMTWKEFSDLSKSAFVEAATDEFGIRGRPTNISRVSLLTGISRKEVKRQRDLLTNEKHIIEAKNTDATRLLSGWYQDPEYLDSESSPRLLDENGPAPSFETLCARYGGDIPMTAMLKELLKTQAIERSADGQLRATRRYYQPAAHDSENLRWAMSLVNDLTETMNNNVFLEKTNTPRFGGSAENDLIPTSALPKFREFVDRHGQAFLEEIDDWLTEHASHDSLEVKERVRIGVGLFAIENKPKMETSK